MRGMSDRIGLVTVEGDRLNRCEMFDETDVDAALARFEELLPPMPRLDDAASRAHDRYQKCFDAFAARDWNATRLPSVREPWITL